MPKRQRMGNYFPPPTDAAVKALSAMLARAKVEPIGAGALRWSLAFSHGDGTKHVEMEIGPDGDFISLATYTEDEK